MAERYEPGLVHAQILEGIVDRQRASQRESISALLCRLVALHGQQQDRHRLRSEDFRELFEDTTLAAADPAEPGRNVTPSVMTTSAHST